MNPTRLVTLEDAAVLAEQVSANRDFLARSEPTRGPEYFTTAGQHTLIQEALESHAAGTTVPRVILDGAGTVVGRITLSDVVRGALQSCSVGYWVSATQNGRGFATAALNDIKRVAFEEMRLHRIQAETLIDNIRSQHVLERSGFVRFGMAPQFLHIAGEWQDHVMYQTLNPKFDQVR